MSRHIRRNTAFQNTAPPYSTYTHTYIQRVIFHLNHFSFRHIVCVCCTQIHGCLCACVCVCVWEFRVACKQISIFWWVAAGRASASSAYTKLGAADRRKFAERKGNNEQQQQQKLLSSRKKKKHCDKLQEIRWRVNHVKTYANNV